MDMFPVEGSRDQQKGDFSRELKGLLHALAVFPGSLREFPKMARSVLGWFAAFPVCVTISLPNRVLDPST
ncbi:hypothetical protein COCON_G00229080 [Conger conger]|uniref:Uncharacterized protein n=1 Tax=Conger conger TaxID=82655 RepID=A0A9Q1HLW8_CONCO|nr:hypothetical protein COCON_G00229080 [Conger conger]